MLGFRGHFSTRSRRYSTTLGDIRADCQNHARDEDITTGRLPLLDEDTVLVISEWEYAGKGYSPGERTVKFDGGAPNTSTTWLARQCQSWRWPM